MSRHRLSLIIVLVVLALSRGRELLSLAASNLGYHWLSGATSLSSASCLPGGTVTACAREYFDRALSLDEANVPARLGRGRTALLSGDTPAAASDIARVLAVRPGHKVAQYLGGQAALALGDWPKAVAYWQVAGAWLDIVMQAEDFLRAGELEKARLGFETMLANGRYQTSSLIGMARIYRQQGELEAALSMAKQAVAPPKEGFWALLTLGGLYLDTEQWTNAIQVFERTIQLSPDLMAAPYLGLAWARYRDQDVAGALAAFADAMRVEPTRMEPYREAAAVLQAVDQPAAAAYWTAVADGSTLDPSAPEMLRGMSALFEGRLDEAEGAFARVLADVPTHVGAHEWLGRVYLAEEKADLAIAQLVEAWSLAPDNPWVAVALGDAYLAGGRREAARDAYREALRVEPGSPPAQQALEALESRDQ